MIPQYLTPYARPYYSAAPSVSVVPVWLKCITEYTAYLSVLTSFFGLVFYGLLLMISLDNIMYFLLICLILIIKYTAVFYCFVAADGITHDYTMHRIIFTTGGIVGLISYIMLLMNNMGNGFIALMMNPYVMDFTIFLINDALYIYIAFNSNLSNVYAYSMVNMIPMQDVQVQPIKYYSNQMPVMYAWPTQPN